MVKTVWIIIFALVCPGAPVFAADPPSVYRPPAGAPQPVMSAAIQATGQKAVDLSQSTLNMVGRHCPLFAHLGSKVAGLANDYVLQPVIEASAKGWNWTKIRLGRATFDVSPEAKRIFDSFHRGQKVSEADLTLLEEQGLMPLFLQFERAGPLMHRWNYALGTYHDLQPHKPRINVLNNLLLAMQTFSKAATLELRHKYADIYTRIYENPEVVLSQKEIALLKADRIYEDVEQFRALVKEKGKFALFSETDMPEYLRREWSKERKGGIADWLIGLNHLIPPEAMTPDTVHAQILERERVKAEPIYRKVGANPDAELTPKERALIDRLGLAEDLWRFRGFVREHQDPNVDTARQMLHARWALEAKRDLGYSGGLVYQLPWEVLSPVIPFSRELTDWRARRLFENQVLESGTLGEKSLEAWMNRKNGKARDIYKKISEDPFYTPDAVEKKRLETAGLTEDIERFRFDLWDKLDAHGTIDPKSVWIEKQLEDHQFGPEAWSSYVNDQLYLDKYYLTESFQKLKAKYKEDPEGFRNAVRVRRWISRAGMALIALAAGAGAWPDQYLSTDDSFDNDAEEESDGMSRYDEKVELIFTSPMPHVSIRIGGLVFNYGQGSVQMMSLDDYQATVGFGKELSASHTRIELKLTEDEARALRERIYQDVGKNYPLVFPYNDCIAMTNRAVRDATGLIVPPVVDRSQVGTIGYYRSLKAGGSSRVGEIRYAALDGNIALKKSQDAAVNLLDGIYFLRNAKQVLVTYPFVEGAAKAGKLTW